MNKNLLFMKTGVLCAEPLGFYDEVAARYEADQHVTDDIHLEINNGRYSNNRDVVLAVREEAERRTAESLALGHNVLYDGYLNTYRRREQVRAIAQETGAAALVLCVHTPLEVILERVMDRHAADELYVPTKLLPNLGNSLRVARDMYATVQWPRQSKESIVNLNGDGSQTIDQLLARVDAAITELPHSVEHSIET